MLKLTILGSGVLIPFPKRCNSGYFLQTDEHTILIDGGSGTLRRIADFGLEYQRIDTVCYTHLHPDHCLDLIPLLFAFNHDPRVSMPRTLKIVAPQGFRDYFDRLMEIYSQWVLPPDLDIEIVELNRATIKLKNLELKTCPTVHTQQSITFRFTSVDGKTFFYSGDTDVNDELISAAQDVDVLLLECSLPDNMKHSGHLTPTECGRIAAQTNCGRLVLTHFYPQVLETDIIATVKKYYRGQVDLAYDGMEIGVGI